VSEWAGALREVEISKDGTTFMFRRYIETGMADVHRRIVEAGFLRNLDADRFAGKAGEIIGDINHIHSFREGNGRTQLTFLQQLADQASHVIDVRKIDGAAWYEASRAAHRGDFAPMGTAIRQAIVD
jgi:cell filamentation protein